jgi:SAM-dependent methyltransferase
MKGDWFKAFGGVSAVEFTEGDYRRWMDTVGRALPLYLKYLPAGSTLLECCCGPGGTAIPLSHHYRVTAFDRNPTMLEYARKNATRFGKDIKVVEAEFGDIARVFGPESFEACSSSGVLEYFTVDEIRKLVDLQLSVAPIVYIVVSLGDGNAKTDAYGITHHGYTQRQWLDSILEEYDVIEHRMLEQWLVVPHMLECEGLAAVIT